MLRVAVAVAVCVLGAFWLTRRRRPSKQNHSDVVEMKPIGFVESVFKDRRGIPRQGNLISLSRARLKFVGQIHPSLSLDGLQQFSHVWLIVHLHQNNHNPQQQKVRIRPPRLQGAKVGLYSTRSPHRHNSIGLSLAFIQQVDLSRGEIIVSGLDLVDGTPILDIKPYIPRYDRPSDMETSVPDWMDETDRLKFQGVEIDDQVLDKILRMEQFDLYDNSYQVLHALQEALCQDVRAPSQLKAENDSEIFSMRFDILEVKYRVCNHRKVVQLIDVVTTLHKN